MTAPKSQQGVALIIILLIVAIVSVLATEMVSRLQLNVARTVNMKTNNQAYWFAVGAEQYALQQLAVLKQSSPDTIHLEQAWAEEFIFPILGGSIEAQVSDMHSCFNLNAMAEEEASTEAQNDANNDTPTSNITRPHQVFHRLLSLVGKENIDSFSVDTFADSVADWIDSDQQMRSYGAEDAEYQAQAIPYLAANAMLSSRSELRIIKGVQYSWLSDLLEQVCVLPNSSAMEININTLTEAQAPLLAAVADIEQASAARLLAARPKDGYSSIDDFLAEPELTNLSPAQRSWLKVTSKYFKLKTKTRYNGATFNMNTVIKVFDTDKVTIESREFGSTY